MNRKLCMLCRGHRKAWRQAAQQAWKGRATASGCRVAWQAGGAEAGEGVRAVGACLPPLVGDGLHLAACCRPSCLQRQHRRCSTAAVAPCSEGTRCQVTSRRLHTRIAERPTSKLRADEGLPTSPPGRCVPALWRDPFGLQAAAKRRSATRQLPATFRPSILRRADSHHTCCPCFVFILRGCRLQYIITHNAAVSSTVPSPPPPPPPPVLSPLWALPSPLD